MLLVVIAVIFPKSLQLGHSLFHLAIHAEQNTAHIRVQLLDQALALTGTQDKHILMPNPFVEHSTSIVFISRISSFSSTIEFSDIYYM